MSDIIEKLGITPGPWEIKESDHDCGIEFDSIGPVCHGWTYGDGWVEAGEDIEEGRRNAMVIAAAPEMLKALIKEARFIEKSTGHSYEAGNNMVKDRLFMVPIIEKAADMPWDKLKAFL